MKKKIKDLTDEEMNNICSNYNKRGMGCGNVIDSHIKCPLYFGKCLKFLIRQIRKLEEEIEL